MSQQAPKYGIYISIIADDEDNSIASEFVPTVSYEQGAEALARLVSHFEKEQSKVATQPLDEDE